MSEIVVHLTDPAPPIVVQLASPPAPVVVEMASVGLPGPPGERGVDGAPGPPGKDSTVAGPAGPPIFVQPTQPVDLTVPFLWFRPRGSGYELFLNDPARTA